MFYTLTPHINFINRETDLCPRSHTHFCNLHASIQINFCHFVLQKHNFQCKINKTTSIWNGFSICIMAWHVQYLFFPFQNRCTRILFCGWNFGMPILKTDTIKSDTITTVKCKRSFLQTNCMKSHIYFIIICMKCYHNFCLTSGILTIYTFDCRMYYIRKCNIHFTDRDTQTHISMHLKINIMKKTNKQITLKTYSSAWRRVHLWLFMSINLCDSLYIFIWLYQIH